MWNIKGVILIVFVLCIARWTTCNTKCYLQVCNKQDADNWQCHYPEEGIEWKCEENHTCSETRVSSDGKIQQVMRGCSEEKDVAVENVKNNGEICKDFDSMGLKYCYCNTPLCNTKMKLPENFEVVVKDKRLYPKQSS